MRVRLLIWLVALLVACQNTAVPPDAIAPERLQQALSGEPDEATEPLIYAAEATFEIPFEQVYVVPAEDFEPFLQEGARPAPSASDVTAAVGIAEVGNTASAIGITGEHFVWCPNGCLVTGSVFVVTPQVNAKRFGGPDNWQVEASDYTIVTAPLTDRLVGWKANADKVLLKPSIATVADSRCCGQPRRCVADEPPGIGGGGCSGPLDRVRCGPDIEGGLLASGTDTTNGRTSAPVVVQVYPASTAPHSNTPVTLSCLAPLGQLASQGGSPGVGECGISLPTCDPPALINIQDPIGRFWSVWLDKSTLCLPGNARPVSGVTVPDHCHAVASPVSVHPECRGHCLDCKTWDDEPDSFVQDYVPPHCAVATYDPENSSICLRGDDKADHVIEQDTWMRQQILDNDCHHPSVTGRCCGEGCVCTETLESGVRLCQQCDADGCKEFALPPAHDPLAAGAAGSDCTVGPEWGVDCSDPAPGGDTPSTPPGPSAPENQPPDPPTPPTGVTADEHKVANNGSAPGAGPTPGKPDPGNHPSASGATPVAATNGKPEAQPSAGDPVGLLAGDLIITQTDLNYAGPVRPLTFTRYYSSQSSHRGALGSNWRHNWEVHLEFLREGTNPPWAPVYCAGGTDEDPRCLLLHGPKGETTLFIYDELTGVFMPQAGSTDTVIRIDNHPFSTDIPNIFRTGWALRTAHGDLMTFDIDGYLVDTRDRFGNGFRLIQEETPLFTLWKDCKAHATSHGGVVPRGCRLVDSLIGEKTLSQERLDPTDGSLELVDVGTHQDLKAWFHANFATGGLVLGRSNYGALRKRPTRVEDDLGRALIFKYGVAGTAGYTHTGAQAHLLVEVEGPSGGIVKLTYGRNPLEPADMNESFLVQVDRADGASTVDVTPTPPRSIVFAYDWAPVPGINVGSGSFGVDGTVFDSYHDYFSTFVGCNASYVDKCRNTIVPWIVLGNPGEYARTAALNLATVTWDNLLTVTAAGILQVGSRFVRTPTSSNYDRVIEQRYGSRQSVPPMAGPGLPQSSQTWTSAEAMLPLATFSYVEAGPWVEPNPTAIPPDRTEYALPTALRNKYPLETATLTNALAEFNPADVGATLGNGSGACRFADTESARRALPGHVPSYVYFEDGRFGGAFNPDLALQRSHLTCEQIAESHRSDAFSNDNLSYLIPAYAGVGTGTTLPDGSFRDVNRHFARRVTGHRDRVAHDANRICQWTHFVDRDGNRTWYGLNFQGQLLVDATALRFDPSNYRVTERRYNADGNVVREFRPFVPPTQGPPGVIAFDYEEIRPNGNSGDNEWLPAWWSRRENLLRRTERLSAGSGSVAVESETSAGSFSQISGTYEAYAYEPVYNQIRLVERGTLSAAAPAVNSWHFRHEYTFDYQELSLNAASPESIKPLLDSLRAWGFRWKTNTSGEYVYQDIANLQLGLSFYNSDLNDDGVRGFPSRVNASNHRGRGVPVHAGVSTPTSGPLKRKQTFQWNWAGRLARYWDDLGNDERRSYYPLKNANSEPVLGDTTAPVAPAVEVMERGFLARVRRRLGPTDYAFSLTGSTQLPCADLSGAYKFLLPSTCSTNPVQDLEAVGFSTEMAQAIVAGSNGGNNAFDDVQVSYNLIGRPRYVWLNGQRSHHSTDVDGRPRSAEAADGTASQYQYDNALRLVRVEQSVGSTVVRQVAMVPDDEGRTIARCEARIPGACATFTMGTRPANASVSEQSFTYEGHPKSSTDEAGVLRTFTVDERGLVWAVLTSAPGTPTFEARRAAWTWDNDGLLVTEAQGQTAGATDTLLSKTWSRNGFGALSAFFDGRTWWNIDRSARGLITHVRETSTPGSSIWSVRFGYDVWGGETERRLNGELVHETLRTLHGLDVGRRGWGLGAEYYAKDYRGRLLWQNVGQEQRVFVYDRENRRAFSAVRPSTTSSPVMLRVGLDPAGRAVEWEQRAATLSRTAHATRNAGGFIQTYTGFDGYSSTTTRNLLGWPTHVERQAGTGGSGVDSEDYVYNELGQATSVTDPKGEITQYGYSPIGELTSLVGFGPRAPNRTWQYDRLSRLDFATRSTSMPGANLDYAWTGLALDEISESGQPIVAFQRDVLGRPHHASSYNPGVQNSVNTEVHVELFYDNVGNVSKEVQTVDGEPHTLESLWSVTGVGRQRTLKIPHVPNGQTEWLETYNARGQLSSKGRLSNGPSTNANFTFLGGMPTGRVENMGHGGSPLRHVVSLDALLQPRSTAWTAVDLDAQGNPVSSAEGAAYCLGQWSPDCATPAFGEDLVRYSSGQLASVLSSFGFPSQVGTARSRWLAPFYGGRGEIVGAFDEWSLSGPPPTGSLRNHEVQPDDVETLGIAHGFSAWTYDREQFTGAVVDVTHSQHGSRLKPGARDPGYRPQTVTVGQQQKQIAHDDDGPIVKFGNFDLFWGPRGELAQVNRSGGANEHYLYDAFGRLVARGEGNGILDTYVWDGHQMVAAFGGESEPNTKWEATWGAGLDELVEFRTFAASGASTEYAPITDFRHSVVGLMEYTTRRSDTLITYTPEGAATIRDDTDDVLCDQASGGDPCVFPHGVPFGFNSSWRSSFTGFSYMRNRWYAGELGEFLSHDPLGAVDSFSLYAFAGFDPVNRADPFGLAAPPVNFNPLPTNTCDANPASCSGATDTAAGPWQAVVQQGGKELVSGYAAASTTTGVAVSLSLGQKFLWAAGLAGAAAAIGLIDPLPEGLGPNPWTEPPSALPTPSGSIDPTSEGAPDVPVGDAPTAGVIGDPLEPYYPLLAGGGTYGLVDPETGDVWKSGRTNDLARRKGELGRNPDYAGLDFVVDAETDDYDEQRGREKELNETYDPPLDLIRPVSPDNQDKDKYNDAADKLKKKIGPPAIGKRLPEGFPRLNDKNTRRASGSNKGHAK